MNFIPADFVTLRRAIFGSAVLMMAVSCAGPQGANQASSPETFDLAEADRKQRFPQVQNIGVVELSGARIKTRPHGNSGDLEYVATGGAFLLKKVQSPIYAQAPEITVTPEVAILRGRQALVRDGDRLISGEGDATEIIIDGTQVKVQGPHLIRNTKTGRSQLVGRAASEPVPAPPPVVAPTAPATESVLAPQPTAPEPALVKEAPKKAKRASKPAVTAEPEIKPAPVAAPAPKKPAVAKPAAPKPASVAAKPVAPKPAVSAPAPKPAAPKPATPDRKELLNLMRDPTE